MTPQCIQAVNTAAGRTLTAAQIKAIDDRISATMRRLARQDPVRWRAMPQDQRVMQAALQAQNDIQAEAARKVTNAQKQALATVATEQRIQTQAAEYGSGRSVALVHEMNTTGHYIEGIKREAMTGMIDAIEAASSRQGAGAGRRALMFLFDADNPAMTRDMVTEIFGGAAGTTGNTLAKAGAKAWLDTIESLRQRFNAAGGDIRQLDYGYLPQPHDTTRVRDAGPAAWAQKLLPKLDRSRYLREDGSLMNDAEVLQFLEAAHETIATDGLNKTAPGAFKGSGARANRGSDSRQIHFKDGQAYLDYMSEFGGGSMYDAMLGHIGGLSRDIGLVERYGPNPAHQMRVQFDIAERADGTLRRVFGNKPPAYWDILSGTTGSPVSARLAQIAQDTRNIQTFGKLAGAVLQSVTDIKDFFVTTGYNKLSYWDAIRNVGKMATDSSARDFLAMHGVMADSMLSDLNRWAGDNIRNNWSGRLANSTMKLSLMNAWTDTLRRGFSMTMMGGLAKMANKRWADLTEWDRSHLQRKGLTEADWDVVTQAQLTTFQGQRFLTPEAIRSTGDPRAGEVVAKVLGLITDESEYAVMNPDLATKAVQTWGGKQAGTINGELARGVMQFKSFPIAMISRHWRRMLEGDRDLEGAPLVANRLAYAASSIVSMTILGAIAFQTKQLVQGKDPAEMDSPKFWAKAMASGGGLSFVGDMLLADTTEDRGQLDTLGKMLLGPTFTSTADLWELTKGNADEAAAGKDTHIGAEALRFARGHLPYLNLWYAKGALDHMGLHALQENLSPGYLQRMRDKAEKDWGQGFWWEPGSGGPDRAPDFANALGE
ncbi:hypothetical protein [Eleftheria terrae]|uniref:hypothetical protein n=1 Tax=Eleftheria terrae TaxID=1597781 RepID=UPI00263B3181|nr:hypothetical protein [Eleftheria terrae]WKB53026.1 hypothetical protein N7L95_01065 [Eleftheria terrae]